MAPNRRRISLHRRHGLEIVNPFAHEAGEFCPVPAARPPRFKPQEAQPQPEHRTAIDKHAPPCLPSDIPPPLRNCRRRLGVLQKFVVNDEQRFVGFRGSDEGVRIDRGDLERGACRGSSAFLIIRIIGHVTDSGDAELNCFWITLSVFRA